jgi:hypothetical protein
MVYQNNNNNNLNNILPKKDDILNHPYIMGFLIFICIFVIVYIIYKYAVTNSPMQGYTYYANDILKLDPLFTENVTTVYECIDLCKNQINCDGITYDVKNNTCIGQKEGRLRTDADNLYAWVKKQSTGSIKTSGTVKDINDISNNKILMSYIKSDNSVTIASKNVPSPPFIDRFSYSFVIRVKDWYENYSYWRHILHKGSPPDKSVNNKTKSLEYHNWENIANDLPEQSLGFWLSPFQNNLRIAITTISKIPKPRSYDHANIEKCRCQNNQNIPFYKPTSQPNVHCSNCWITDQEGDLEHKEDSALDFKDYQTIDYVDIQDLQTNVPLHVAVSLYGNIIEVYINGVFKVNKVLNGTPKWNNGDLYIHNPKTYNGSLNNLMVISGTINNQIAVDLYNQYLNNSD